MSDAKREVDELRQEIARLDTQLLVTLEKRARAARRIGELRKDLPPALPLADRASIRALVARGGDMPPEALREIFREIFAACLALELPVKVAYAGPEGGAGHAAARGRFGGSGGPSEASKAGGPPSEPRSSGRPGVPSTLLACETTLAALEEVVRRRAEYAVVPIETSYDGLVQATVNGLIATDLRIAEQLDATFELHLVNRTGNVGDIEKVYATPADHALCLKTVSALGARVALVDVKSPLMACQLAVEDHGAAALSSESFAAALGLEVARRNVLDSGSDRVRYAVVGRRPSGRTGSDTTAFVFSVQDAPGSLLDALKQFAERGINLTKLQSRPVHSDAWQYLFFAEVQGHFTDRPLVAAFEEIRRSTKFFKVLGSYPTLA